VNADITNPGVDGGDPPPRTARPTRRTLRDMATLLPVLATTRAAPVLGTLIRLPDGSSCDMEGNCEPNKTEELR
jgi:hypothetical protein